MQRLTSFIIILLMVAAVASILVNATGPDAADPLSYTTGSASQRYAGSLRDMKPQTSFLRGIAIAARLQVYLQKHRSLHSPNVRSAT